MVLVLGAALVFSYFGRPIGPGSGGSRTFHWSTSVASLEANSVSIHADDSVFTPQANATVHSDPGTPTYRTLEMSWAEQGVPMNMNIYFAADSENWWVTEIRTYNGRSPGDWIYYESPAIKAPLGDSYVGDVNLDSTSSDSNASGRLTIAGLRLTAFEPGSGVTWQPGCQPAAPAASGVPDAQAEASTGQIDLSRYGVSAGMTAGAADHALTDAKICHDFRLNYVIGAAAGYAQVWCTAPDGDVANWAVGSEGQVILFVNAAPGRTLAPSAPEIVNCG